MGVDRAAMRTRAADAKPITLTPRNWEQFKELQGVREHCLGETPVFFRCFVTEKVLTEKGDGEGEGWKGEDAAEESRVCEEGVCCHEDREEGSGASLNLSAVLLPRSRCWREKLRAYKDVGVWLLWTHDSSYRATTWTDSVSL